MKALLLLTLFATGCAVAARTERPSYTRQRPRVSFQVDPTDTVLYAAATRAAAAWAYALGADISVAPDGDVPIFWVQDVNAEPGCEMPPDVLPGAWSSACSPGVGTPDAHIVIKSDQRTNTLLYMWVLHEMGHILRGAAGHVDDPGLPLSDPNAILQTYNRGITDAAITLDDVQFVCQCPASVQCLGPLGRLSNAGLPS